MIQKNAVSERERKKLFNQQYRIAGSHAAVKICLWCKNSIRGKGVCYKKQFYGIDSWRCVQMTPIVTKCTENCVFCWRTGRYNNKLGNDWDGVEEIIDKSIEEHKELLKGFGGNEKASKKLLEEAMEPKHFAISLAGEPTLYPYLPEMVESLKKRGITSFIVTNGTNPEMIRKLINVKPTQLYVTLAGPNRDVFRKAVNPIQKDAWERLQETLGMLKEFKRTVIRLTMVKGMNMVNPEGYAKIIEKSSPTFVEVKAYMHVGGSTERLKEENMPTHNEIMDFAKDIERNSSYKIVDEMVPSRVVLLAREGTRMPDYCMGIS